jgi:hypothetical protein
MLMISLIKCYKGLNIRIRMVQLILCVLHVESSVMKSAMLTILTHKLINVIFSKIKHVKNVDVLLINI